MIAINCDKSGLLYKINVNYDRQSKQGYPNLTHYNVLSSCCQYRFGCGFSIIVAKGKLVGGASTHMPSFFRFRIGFPIQ